MICPDYTNPANQAKPQMIRLCFAARHACECPLHGRHVIPVPKVMKPVYEKIVGLTDDVCDKTQNTGTSRVQ
jgi:hypothetical protein